MAWHKGNSDGQTHPVASKQPNELGLYDMSGNVFEWYQDIYESGYYYKSPSTDPIGPSSGPYNLYRGGSWSHSILSCRPTCRYCIRPGLRLDYYGFRLVLLA